MNYKQWMTNPANKTKKQVAVAILLVLGLLAFWWSASTFINWLHDVNYNAQQTADKTAANKAEASATKHETNANTAADSRKELEQNETNIKQQQADQQKVLTNDRQTSADTRKQLDKELHKTVPDHFDDTSLSDDQLRADSDRAAADFDPGRITPTPTP